LDCLGAPPVRRESPVYRLLDLLGFTWILSSESRLINGLHGKNDERFFSALLRDVGSAGTVDYNLGMREGRIVHGQSLP
jgi:hypothetical protein